ncbi:MAG: hypothetical protein GY928_05990 [Colwellia sp.]|nr:hypothetical protein [Colwellia sp.]
MIKSIGLCRLTLNGHHVEGLNYSLDEARLATAFRQSGLIAKLYAGRPEGSIKDIARQIARMRTEAVIFSVSTESLSTTLQLCKTLKKLKPALNIYWWGYKLNTDLIKAIDSKEIKVIIETSPEKFLTQLIELKVIELAPFKSMIHNKVITLPSPYTSELLSQQDANRLGLTLSQPFDILKNEIKWLNQQHININEPICIDARDLTKNQLENFISVYTDFVIQFPFKLKLSCDVSNESIHTLLTQQKLTEIQWYGLQTYLPNALKKDSTTNKIKVSLFDPYLTVEEITQQYGKNGFHALHSGHYPINSQMASIYHIEVSSEMTEAQKNAAYDWAAPNMALRSAAVVNSVGELSIERVKALQLPLNKETNGWPNHTYTISLDDANKGDITFDGNQSVSSSIQYQPFSSQSEAKIAPNSISISTVENKVDIEALEQRLEKLHTKGEITIPPLSSRGLLENSCRWGRFGNCKVTLLPRLSVDKNENVSACRSSNSIGVVGDSYEDLQSRVKQQQQLKSIERGCINCPVVDDCSQCSNLPEQWEGRYCEIRQKYPKTPLMLEMKIFPYFISHFIKNENEPIELKVSEEGLPAQFYHGDYKESRTGNRPILISACEQHFAWWRGTKNIMRLSAPLILMAEAWWKGAENESIESFLCKAFSVDIGTAKSSLKEGLLKLQEQGVIHG